MAIAILKLNFFGKGAKWTKMNQSRNKFIQTTKNQRQGTVLHALQMYLNLQAVEKKTENFKIGLI